MPEDKLVRKVPSILAPPIPNLEVADDAYLRAQPTIWAWLRAESARVTSATLKNHADALRDFLVFWNARPAPVEGASAEDIAAYIADLDRRPPERRARRRVGASLSDRTIELRLLTLRGYYDYLIEQGERGDNPVPPGRFSTGTGFGQLRAPAELPRSQRTPPLASDEDWWTILRTLRDDTARNRAMVLVAYQGALRREEVVTLLQGDVDLDTGALRVPVEPGQREPGHPGRWITLSEHTMHHLTAYLRQSREGPRPDAPLFASDSPRTRTQPLAPRAWTRIIEHLATRADVPILTPGALRYLRLAHLARAGSTPGTIAYHAGTQRISAARRYVRLAKLGRFGASLPLQVFDGWLAMSLEPPPTR